MDQRKLAKTGVSGRLAQLVERALCMREVEGSKPSMSNFFDFFSATSSISVDGTKIQFLVEVNAVGDFETVIGALISLLLVVLCGNLFLVTMFTSKIGISCTLCRNFKIFASRLRKFSSTVNVNSKTNIFSKYWNKYLELLETKPISTKAITSGCISFTADVLCQRIDQENHVSKNDKISFQWDKLRTFKFSLLGLCFIGPTLHFWYTNLFRMLPGTNLGRVIQRLALDQFLFSPTFICTIMSLVLVLDRSCDGLLNKELPNESLLKTIENKLRQEYATTVQTSWLVWLPASFINFKFIRVELQTLFSNCVGLLWNIYLSKVAHNTVEMEIRTPSESM